MPFLPDKYFFGNNFSVYEKSNCKSLQASLQQQEEALPAKLKVLSEE
jgi:hypothetical protein